MQPRRGIDGSPDRKRPQALHPTAESTSSPEGINITPVPLFLVPAAVADAIRYHGQAVVIRTREGVWMVPLASLRRVASGEAASAPLFGVVV